MSWRLTANSYGNDVVSNLFAAGILFIVTNTIPIWNGIMAYQLIRIVVIVLLTGAVYDLAKTAISKLYAPRHQ